MKRALCLTVAALLSACGSETSYDWTRFESGTSEILRSVWASGANNAWAVGYSGTMLQWNGSAWSAVPSGVASTLARVRGTSPTNVWVAGDMNEVLRWTGSSWATSTAPDGAKDLVTFGPDQTYVATGAFDPPLSRYNGSAWEAVPAGTGGPQELLDLVWGSSPTDLWAVSSFGDTAWHYNGSGWEAFTIPGASFISWEDLTGSGPNDAWLIGTNMGSAVAYRWNGSSWAAVSSAAFSDFYPGKMYAVSPTNAYLPGHYGHILHWNGSTFEDSLPLEMKAANVLGIGGTATDIWAVGAQGLILKYTP